MVRKPFIIISILVPSLTACNLILGRATPIIQPILANEPWFSEITFCEHVEDEGECIAPTNQFPNGLYTVWAYFTYENMADGIAWGHVWEKNSEVFADTRGEIWNHGEQGWLTYSITDEEPLTGEFTFTLYINDEPVQRETFSISTTHNTANGDSPAFGPIQFAKEVTKSKTPIEVSARFNDSIQRVYATFPYHNIPMNQVWGKEWIFNDRIVDMGEFTWGTPSEGITYLYIENSDSLAPGTYTLNLYLDGQKVRSASFEVAAADEPQVEGPSAHPTELIDPELLPAYTMLVNSDDQLLYRLGEMITDYQVEMRMEDSLGSGIAAYSYNSKTCGVTEIWKRKPGKILVSRQKYNTMTWEEMAASIAHELTHAHQHLSARGRCEGCSIEKEYEAFFVTIHALCEMGRLDIAQDNYPGIVDDQCTIYGDALWDWLRQVYTDCPDY